MWEIKKVTKRGNQIEVLYEKQSDKETSPKKLVWSWDDKLGLTEEEFLQMVQREAQLMLDEMNRQEEGQDLTELFA